MGFRFDFGYSFEEDDMEMKAHYFELLDQTQEYAREFFRDSVGYFQIENKFDKRIDDEILPIYCYDLVMSNFQGLETLEFIDGGFQASINNKQSIIYIGIDMMEDELSERNKQTIRHEICHYCLWVNGMGCNDDDLDFWCYAYMFDAHPYMPLSEDDQERFIIFKKTYDKYVKDLHRFEKMYTVALMMKRIHDEDLNTFEAQTAVDAALITEFYKQAFK